jgi:hypothetical protein
LLLYLFLSLITIEILAAIRTLPLLSPAFGWSPVQFTLEYQTRNSKNYCCWISVESNDENERPLKILVVLIQNRRKS